MIKIYTDGSANWKNGKGGCAAVFVKDEEVVNVYSKGLTNTKTGRSEIHAILMALKNIPNGVEKIIINSDSQYCVNTIEKGWLDNWLRSGEQKKNMDLWIEIKKHLDNLKRRNINCKLQHIKGHNGNLYNELADYYADYKRYL